MLTSVEIVVLLSVKNFRIYMVKVRIIVQIASTVRINMHHVFVTVFVCMINQTVVN